MMLFGVWDLVYYAVLKLILGWPESLATWDILFLLPVPWIGPVWAPCIIAVALVAVGSYLYWTADRPRHYHVRDWLVVITAGLIVIAAFVSGWRVVNRRGCAAVLPGLAVLGGVRARRVVVHRRRTPHADLDCSAVGEFVTPGPLLAEIAVTLSGLFELILLFYGPVTAMTSSELSALRSSTFLCIKRSVMTCLPFFGPAET